MRQYPTDTVSKVQEYLILRQKVKHILNQYKISEYELNIIEYLHENSRYRVITAKEVYQELNLDRGWVYRSLRKLEDLRYIARTKKGWIFENGYVIIILSRIRSILGKL